MQGEQRLFIGKSQWHVYRPNNNKMLTKQRLMLIMARIQTKQINADFLLGNSRSHIARYTPNCYIAVISAIKASRRTANMSTNKNDGRFVRLPVDLLTKLAEIAQREDRSVAGTVRALVRDGIARRTPNSSPAGACNE